MSVYIKNVQIDRFRGIRKLKLDKLNHVNLIVGDNNSGKTSILEALLFLRNPATLSNVLRVARQREMAISSGNVTVYESFMCLFPRYDQTLEIKLSALRSEERVEFLLHGEQKQILLDETEMRKTQRRTFTMEGMNRVPNEAVTNMEASAFVGSIDCSIGDKRYSEPINLNEYSRVSGMEIGKDMLDMVYLSPIDHFSGSIINGIIRNDDYKAICLRVVQLFDADIQDLLILKNEQTNRPVEYINHRVLGKMPVSTYGDGIKKVLLLANAIAQAAGGVLLIDEVETSIHAHYYDDIFRFLLKACMQYDVQVFITTHNLEAVDALLVTQDYHEQQARDDVSVITLRRGEDRTYSRVMAGREAYQNREDFDFEVC